MRDEKKVFCSISFTSPQLSSHTLRRILCRLVYGRRKVSALCCLVHRTGREIWGFGGVMAMAFGFDDDNNEEIEHEDDGVKREKEEKERNENNGEK